MPDKGVLIKKVIEALRKEKETNEMGLASARQGAKEAPSAMESHSDTTRSQMQHLAENLEKNVKDKEEAIRTLEAFKISAGDVPRGAIGVGSLADISDETGARLSYFILPAGGNAKLAGDGKEIIAISMSAPLAKALIGKKAGETATLATGPKTREFKILDVF